VPYAIKDFATKAINLTVVMRILLPIKNSFLLLPYSLSYIHAAADDYIADYIDYIADADAIKISLLFPF
jgi:hypothetical protein